MRIVILDLGAGNLHSLAKAFDHALAGAEVTVETDPAAAVASADLLALPGVGAFGPAAAQLAPHRPRVRDALLGGLPAIGICLGMQLLFDGSDEGPGAGLGVIAGRVQRMDASRLPHMGWSAVVPVAGADAALAAALPSAAYFAHSFACRADDPAAVLATATVEDQVVAAVVRRGRTFGCQFHPEKSSSEGVRFLGWLAQEALAR